MDTCSLCVKAMAILIVLELVTIALLFIVFMQTNTLLAILTT